MPPRGSSLFALGLCAAALLQSAPSAAQNNTAHKATAEAYFDDALRLMQSGSFAEACPKLEASQRLDPAVGTLLYLGECYERRGRTASAWVTFREAEALAKATSQPQRAEMARARVERLQGSIARVTVELSSEARAIAGLRVTCGSVPIDPSLPGVALPVDPGELVVEASAPGYTSLSRTVTVPAAGKLTVSIPGLARQAGSAPTPRDAPPSPSVATEALTSPPSPPRPVAQQPSSPSLLWPVTLGAVGVVGLGVGTVFGVKAMSKASDASEICPQGQCREERGTSLMDSARTSANVSNVAFAVGALALVGGVVVYLVDKPKRADEGVAIATWLGPGQAGLVLRGGL